jgi:hypothetical protein
MKIERTRSLVTTMVALALLGTAMVAAPPPPIAVIAYDQVLPSDTDDGATCDGPGIPEGIGCDNYWDDDNAINVPHFLYVPANSKQEGKLLVVLGGGNGGAKGPENIQRVAAQLGYHVIGLTYHAGHTNECEDNDLGDEQLDCFGDFVHTNVTGKCPKPIPSVGCEKSTIADHPQDSLVNRLISVLKWARQYDGDHYNEDHGWDRYLTFTNGVYGVNWAEVHLAGGSNGSTHASYMGTLYQDIGRVALFVGPDDGDGGREHRLPASYIRRIEGITNTRYYGLVHEKNKAPSDEESDNRLYRVESNWVAFGMEGPDNPPALWFEPEPSPVPLDLHGEHVLISRDVETRYWEAHESTMRDQYCSESEIVDGKIECVHDGFDGGTIGYEPAWRCIMGTGNKLASQRPFADAGPDQTVECQANGGAQVELDGSGSNDLDCDVLSYLWTGPFGEMSVRKPMLFLPVGTHAAELVASDIWRPSFPDTTSISVVDTIPPSLQVTLTPTSIWPPNHRLVRIDAVVTAADTCTPPHVVLTSITSDQPDDGTGDGDTAGDIEDAQVDTLDRSFLVRAERSGGDKNGRTYTVTYTATDASGNKTNASATVHVPH